MIITPAWPEGPVEGAVYIGGPSIQPAYLRGRRILVERVVSKQDLDREGAEPTTHRRKGSPAEERAYRAKNIVLVKVKARGRVVDELIANWDAKPVSAGR